MEDKVGAAIKSLNEREAGELLEDITWAIAMNAVRSTMMAKKRKLFVAADRAVHSAIFGALNRLQSDESPALEVEKHGGGADTFVRKMAEGLGRQSGPGIVISN